MNCPDCDSVLTMGPVFAQGWDKEDAENFGSPRIAEVKCLKCRKTAPVAFPPKHWRNTLLPPPPDATYFEVSGGPLTVNPFRKEVKNGGA